MVKHRQEWGEALAELTGDEIKLGLYRCRKEKTWPPSIAEFIELAKPRNPEDWRHKGAAYRYFKRGLPKPRNKEAALEAIRGIKAVL